MLDDENSPPTDLAFRWYDGMFDHQHGLAAQWQSLFSASGHCICSPDMTCSHAWALALANTLVKGRRIRVAVLSDSYGVAAILPVCCVPGRLAGLIRCNHIFPVTEAHGGRTGVVSRNDSEKYVGSVLKEVAQGRDWDVGTITTVKGSTTHSKLLELLRGCGFSFRLLSTRTAPYIQLGETWDKTFSGLPKKLRWLIRKSERDLKSLGHLTYRNLGEQGPSDEILGAIEEIERNSWKEHSGTSMTSQPHQLAFFKAWMEAAVGDDALDFHCLYSSGTPIAYILGAVYGNEHFLDLKESFRLDYGQYSPAHVLKRFAIGELISRGVRVYDFMGKCEPYKMRWTSQTYTCETHAVYNDTVGGRLVRASSAFKAGMNRFFR